MGEFVHAGAAAPILRRPMVETTVVEQVRSLSFVTGTTVKQQVWVERLCVTQWK